MKHTGEVKLSLKVMTSWSAPSPLEWLCSFLPSQGCISDFRHNVPTFTAHTGRTRWHCSDRTGDWLLSLRCHHGRHSQWSHINLNSSTHLPLEAPKLISLNEEYPACFGQTNRLDKSKSAWIPPNLSAFYFHLLDFDNFDKHFITRFSTNVLFSKEAKQFGYNMYVFT